MVSTRLPSIRPSSSDVARASAARVIVVRAAKRRVADVYTGAFIISNGNDDGGGPVETRNSLKIKTNIFQVLKKRRKLFANVLKYESTRVIANEKFQRNLSANFDLHSIRNSEQSVCF